MVEVPVQAPAVPVQPVGQAPAADAQSIITATQAVLVSRADTNTAAQLSKSAAPTASVASDETQVPAVRVDVHVSGMIVYAPATYAQVATAVSAAAQEPAVVASKSPSPEVRVHAVVSLVVTTGGPLALSLKIGRHALRSSSLFENAK